jgi:uncharacterized protein YecE (DUF72 family)
MIMLGARPILRTGVETRQWNVRGIPRRATRNFVFAFKVPEDITVSTLPTHARYGKRTGPPNEYFLDPKTLEQFFTKRLEPNGKRVGPLIFEFGTFNNATFPKPGDFLVRLDPFLASLPHGFRYAVEIRNENYLTPEYPSVLAFHNVAHTLNAWTRMPPLDQQARVPGVYTADVTVVRALLRCGRAYDKAVQSFEPYREIQEVNKRGARGQESDCQRNAKLEE